MRTIGQHHFPCQNHQVKIHCEKIHCEIFRRNFKIIKAIVEQQLGGAANLPCLESDEDKGSTEPYKVTIYFGDANDNEHDVSNSFSFKIKFQIQTLIHVIKVLKS